MNAPHTRTVLYCVFKHTNSVSSKNSRMKSILDLYSYLVAGITIKGFCTDIGGFRPDGHDLSSARRYINKHNCAYSYALFMIL